MLLLEIKKFQEFIEYNNIKFDTNLSIMFWIKLNNNRNNRELLVGSNPHIFGIILERSDSNQISFYCGDGSKINNKHAKYKAYSGRLPYDNYQHLCYTRNSNSIDIYVNGKLKASYNFPLNDILFEETINIGKSKVWYLDDFSQQLRDFKVYNNTLTQTEIKEIVYNNIDNYYFDNETLMNYIFNYGNLNYRFIYDNKTYIYNKSALINYIDNYESANIFSYFMKFNTIINKNVILDNISLKIDENIIDNDEIYTIVKNIMSWQFGMYQNIYPKDIPETATGFWSADITNFFIPYTNQDIRYNRGTTQEGVGTFIKLIIDYYLKYETSNLRDDCIQSINLFIDYLNVMIYDNGGVPLYYPLSGGYRNMITLNDCAMINYLRCCDFILKSEIKQEINSNKIILLEENYKKVLNCLLQLQVIIDDKKTIWPQQADPITLNPVKGRSFELESLCSLESVQILYYLMSISNPSEEIKNAINSGCLWYENNLILNYKQHLDNNNNIVLDNTIETVNPLWGRYYSLDDQKPITFDRDGNIYNIDEFNTMPIERRNGYTWFGMWGTRLLDVYVHWKKLN